MIPETLILTIDDRRKKIKTTGNDGTKCEDREDHQCRVAVRLDLTPRIPARTRILFPRARCAESARCRG